MKFAPWAHVLDLAHPLRCSVSFPKALANICRYPHRKEHHTARHETIPIPLVYPSKRHAWAIV